MTEKTPFLESFTRPPCGYVRLELARNGFTIHRSRAHCQHISRHAGDIAEAQVKESLIPHSFFYAALVMCISLGFYSSNRQAHRFLVKLQ
jgi:hypothetical protein